MPGLLRTAGRTAAVVGTANAVTNKQQKKFAAQDAQAQQAAAYQQQAQPQQAPPPSAPAAAEDETIAKLKELATLHSQGILPTRSSLRPRPRRSGSRRASHAAAASGQGHGERNRRATPEPPGDRSDGPCSCAVRRTAVTRE
jgi:hypothetical protein